MASYVDGDFTLPVMVSERPVYVDPGSTSRIAWIREYVQNKADWTPTPINTMSDGELSYVTFEEVIGYIGPLIKYRQTFQTIPGQDPDNPFDDGGDGGKATYGTASFTYPGYRVKRTRVVVASEGEPGARRAVFGDPFYSAQDGVDPVWVKDEEYLQTVAEPITKQVLTKTTYKYFDGAPPEDTPMPGVLLAGSRMTQYQGWDYGADGSIVAVTGSVGDIVFVNVSDAGGGLTEVATTSIYKGADE